MQYGGERHCVGRGGEVVGGLGDGRGGGSVLASGEPAVGDGFFDDDQAGERSLTDDPGRSGLSESGPAGDRRLAGQLAGDSAIVLRRVSVLVMLTAFFFAAPINRSIHGALAVVASNVSVTRTPSASGSRTYRQVCPPE